MMQQMPYSDDDIISNDVIDDGHIRSFDLWPGEFADDEEADAFIEALEAFDIHGDLSGFVALLDRDKPVSLKVQKVIAHIISGAVIICRDIPPGYEASHAPLTPRTIVPRAVKVVDAYKEYHPQGGKLRDPTTRYRQNQAARKARWLIARGMKKDAAKKQAAKEFGVVPQKVLECMKAIEKAAGPVKVLTKEERAEADRIARARHEAWVRVMTEIHRETP
jgi:hypothetical protein